MADEPEQPATTEPPAPRTHFDALPYPHPAALDAGLAWVVHLAFEALQQVEKGLPTRYTGQRLVVAERNATTGRRQGLNASRSTRG